MSEPDPPPTRAELQAAADAAYAALWYDEDGITTHFYTDTPDAV